MAEAHVTKELVCSGKRTALQYLLAIMSTREATGGEEDEEMVVAAAEEEVVVVVSGEGKEDRVAGAIHIRAEVHVSLAIFRREISKFPCLKLGESRERNKRKTRIGREEGRGGRGGRGGGGPAVRWLLVGCCMP